MSQLAEGAPTSEPADAATATGPSYDGLRLHQLTKSFGGGFTAVEALDLDVPRGSFFALLGPSGCGKTTTLRMVAGLETPTSGSITLSGQDITFAKPYRRPVNTVFQSYALFPHLDIYENVAFGLRRRRAKEVKAKVEAMLDLVELTNQARKKPAQLSGGQQQRVALARALINEPEVLLLDEPLGALDLKLRRAMQIEIKRIQTEVQQTFIHVTHDQEEAMTMADTVAVMNAGVIEQMGAPAELYENPRSTFVANFLGQSNLISGTVVSRSADVTTVDMHGIQVSVPAGRTHVDGDRGWVGIRPEKVLIGEEGAELDAPGNTIPGGVISDVSFVGVSTQYLVRMPWGQEVQVFSQNTGRTRMFRTGERVELSWRPEYAFLLDQAQDATAGSQRGDQRDDQRDGR
ncbi:MAG: transporter ATP-binding protein [Nocardioides sp.]|nr:transporter ATP-binding protein [Nocardioides sp.]